MGDANGTVELWSTQAEVRSQLGYCLFNVGRQSEHVGIVTAMDIFRKEGSKAITGSSDYSLKIWDMGAGDLISINTYRFAHADSITGVSTSPANPDLFATCSRDKCFNVWDKRLPAPIVDYNEKHSIPYTSIYWSSFTECQEDILLGDDLGNVHTVDTRNLSTFVHSFQPCETPIHKIAFENTFCTILGHCNRVKVFDVKENYNLSYENDKALDYVRDVQWTDTHEFFTTGWDSQLRKHKIKKE